MLHVRPLVSVLACPVDQAMGVVMHAPPNLPAPALLLVAFVPPNVAVLRPRASRPPVLEKRRLNGQAIGTTRRRASRGGGRALAELAVLDVDGVPERTQRHLIQDAPRAALRDGVREGAGAVERVVHHARVVGVLLGDLDRLGQVRVTVRLWHGHVVVLHDAPLCH